MPVPARLQMTSAGYCESETPMKFFYSDYGLRYRTVLADHSYTLIPMYQQYKKHRDSVRLFF